MARATTAETRRLASGTSPRRQNGRRGVELEPVWLALVVAMVFSALVPSLTRADAASDLKSKGEAIYAKQCAYCHGDKGEGTKDDYPQALIGEKSLDRLSAYIAKSMPEDDPGTCVGDDAKAVAAFIFDAFYSKEAQLRAKPPRVELSRLTVRQHRNALADLIDGFREPAKRDDRQGLQGHYFDSKRVRRDRDSAMSRVDPEVRFNFGHSSPNPDKIKPGEFAVRWEGSVVAPETGSYEFVVKTENSAKLWVNDLQQPLIDVYVKSGSDTEYRASISLIAGHAYPLRLEYFKANQGVNKKDEKAEAMTASVSLEWAIPHRPVEVIPRHLLFPLLTPESYVSATPFPPDDRSMGYERGSSISREWEQATTDAAIATADYVTTRLRRLSGVGDQDPDREAKLRSFAARFVERAFRRPLTDQQRALYVDQQFESAKDLETAVKRVVILALKSPRFLYLDLEPTPDAYTVASRLSFGLWDSIPDKALLDAAKANQLKTKEQVTAQAERMVNDPRCRSKLRAFFLSWLKVEHVPDLAKDSKLYPDFDTAIASDLRTSLDLLVDDLVWNDASDFRQLLLSKSLYLNGPLARFYQVDLPEDAPFQKVEMSVGDRAGVLTHPYLMASFAYNATSSPIHRGVFLARNVLGLPLRPPPEAFPPLSPDLHPELNTRERVTLQTSPESCQSCHTMINPLGFPLEAYDAVGRFRDEEKGRPIDATGSYQTRSGELIRFKGPRELATFLASSEDTHNAFVAQLFHNLVKQPIRAFGPSNQDDLRSAFASSDFHIRKLAVKIVADSALAQPEGANALSQKEESKAPNKTD